MTTLQIRSPLPADDSNARSMLSGFLKFVPCVWQTQVLRLLDARTILVTAPTGAGKILTFILPLLLYLTGLSILVTPLKEIGAQMEAILLKLSILSINLTSSTATNEIYTAIANLKYRLIIISPELLMNDPRMNALWKKRKFTDNIINIIIDEAHVVKDWAPFRSAYELLGTLRYIIGRSVPFLLATATLSPADTTEVLKSLKLDAEPISAVSLSLDRPNIFYRVHKMTAPISSYHDLQFILTKYIQDPSHKPPKFLVFVNSRNEAQAAAEYLRSFLLPADKEKVKWFHSGMSDEFRAKEMASLLAGDSFGYCATDAAGMGIDIPDIGLVVQYRVPERLSTLMQRAGRAGRNGNDVMFVLVAEPRYFDEEKTRKSSADKENIAPRGDQSPAHKRPRLERNDAETPQIEEDMDTFINAPNRACRCRRVPVLGHFTNSTSQLHSSTCCDRCQKQPSTYCCDVCHPEHQVLDLPSYQPQTRATAKYKIPQHRPTAQEIKLQEALLEFREVIAKEILGDGTFLPSSVVLSDTMLDRIVGLAHYKKLPSDESLELMTTWAYTSSHGKRLLDCVNRFYPLLGREVVLPASLSHLRPSLAQNTPIREVHNEELARKRAPPKCTACHQLGHKRTSKKCPAFTNQ